MRGAHIGVRSDAVEEHRVSVAVLQFFGGEGCGAVECDGVDSRVKVPPCDSVANSNGQC